MVQLLELQQLTSLQLKKVKLLNHVSMKKSLHSKKILKPVSYTHLDVYKRQELNHSKDKGKHHGNVGQVGVVDVNVLVELAGNLQVHDQLKIPR